VKVAEYVAQWLVERGVKRVYAVCGSGAMHLNDAICHHPGLQVIPMQHEQAATFAAEADARLTNDLAVVHVTSGPGGTNCVTGLSCAFVDGIPLLVIAGQVTSNTMIGRSDLRQRGMNEVDTMSLVGPITKTSVTLKRPGWVREHLEAAYFWAMEGRRGPVFIEIPIDVQAAEINPDTLPGFNSNPWKTEAPCNASNAWGYLADSKRPVLIVGNGCRGSTDEVRELVDRLNIPVVSSWAASDIIPNHHPCYIGRCGLFGDRASNWAVQHSDLILALGSRLSVGQIGHIQKLFAPEAVKIVIDIDPEEAIKYADMAIVADVKDFIQSVRNQWLYFEKERFQTWVCECVDRIEVSPKRAETKGMSAYGFAERLNRFMDDDAIVVTDAGFAFVTTMQTLRLNGRQRLMYSQGVAPMGWGLPAAIGASLAAPGRQVIALIGDGGLMFSAQSLHTIATLDLPITIFVYCNDGYATMRLSQNNHFKREAIAGPNSGNPISVEDVCRIGQGFGILTTVRDGDSPWDLSGLLLTGDMRPLLVALKMDPNETISPRVQPRMENGKFLPSSLSDMNV
jgi:acetolactate synthase I/II/III large subunit